MSLNKSEILQIIHERETSVVKTMLAQISDLRRTDPEYFAHLEDTDLDEAPRAELVELMANAPNDQVRGFLFGRHSARVALAAVTGREFV